jgi:hypothetical protein
VPANKRKRFTVALQEEFLDHLRQGMRRGATAQLLGFGRMTITNYIEDHPEFEKRVLDAESEATEHVQEALYQAAVSGNVSAARAWLELFPNRVVHSGVAMPQPPPREPREALEEDEDELFPSNVTHLDPRQRRKHT